MNKKQQYILITTSISAIAFGIIPVSNAMHIMEGYLPGSYCIAWGALCIPFLLAGFPPVGIVMYDFDGRAVFSC